MELRWHRQDNIFSQTSVRQRLARKYQAYQCGAACRPTEAWYGTFQTLSCKHPGEDLARRTPPWISSSQLLLLLLRSIFVCAPFSFRPTTKRRGEDHLLVDRHDPRRRKRREKPSRQNRRPDPGRRRRRRQRCFHLFLRRQQQQRTLRSGTGGPKQVSACQCPSESNLNAP